MFSIATISINVHRSSQTSVWRLQSPETHDRHLESHCSLDCSPKKRKKFVNIINEKRTTTITIRTKPYRHSDLEDEFDAFVTSTVVLEFLTLGKSDCDNLAENWRRHSFANFWFICRVNKTNIDMILLPCKRLFLIGNNDVGAAALQTLSCCGLFHNRRTD